MTNEVYVAVGDDASETATLLLAAAAELELDAGVVRYASHENAFGVPEEVAAKAKLETFHPGAEHDAAVEEAVKVADQGPEQAAAANAERVAAEPVLDDPEPGSDAAEAPKAPAKKAAAKKAPAKKAATQRPAKKAAAKKSTAKKAGA